MDGVTRLELMKKADELKVVANTTYPTLLKCWYFSSLLWSVSGTWFSGVQSARLHSTVCISSCHVILTLSPAHPHPHTHTHTPPHTYMYSLICVQSRLNSEISHGKKAGTSPTPSPFPPHTASHQHVYCLPGVTPFHLMSLGHTPFLSIGNFGNTMVL